MDEAGVENTIRMHRAIRNLTQAELAELAGITRASVNAIEGGRMNPSIFLALKLARALDASVDALFQLTDSKFEQQSPPGR
jgi:putative transcriptional regulator